VFQNGTGQGKHSAGQRINSAPTKLTNNNQKKSKLVRNFREQKT